MFFVEIQIGSNGKLRRLMNVLGFLRKIQKLSYQIRDIFRNYVFIFIQNEKYISIFSLIYKLLLKCFVILP